jgi:hypothetical protein
MSAPEDAALLFFVGKCPRLRGPGLFNLDFAAHKSFSTTERVSAERRLESFNLTNTRLLGNPIRDFDNSSFGQITSAGTPRDNQIGLYRRSRMPWAR